MTAWPSKLGVPTVQTGFSQMKTVTCADSKTQPVFVSHAAGSLPAQEGSCQAADGRRQINSSARDIKTRLSVCAVGGAGGGGGMSGIGIPKLKAERRKGGVNTAGLPRCRLLLAAPSSSACPSPSAYSRCPVKEHYQLAAR